MQCSEQACPAPATVIFTARGGAAGVHRAATACDGHRGAVRGWVARAGPAVQETPIDSGADTQPATLF